MDLTGFFVIITILVILGALLFKYLEGDFSYSDEIYSSKIYNRNVRSPYTGEWLSAGDLTRVVIKRTYHSGKIKFITKEHKS